MEVDSSNKDIAPAIHHLSISYSGQQVSKYLNKLDSMWTIIDQTTPHMSLVEACISRSKSLRVLDLSGSSFEMLPSSIGTQKHLRYLNLACNRKIKKLLDTICKLQNFQALQLDGCDNLERLPKDIRNMISLSFSQ